MLGIKPETIGSTGHHSTLMAPTPQPNYHTLHFIQSLSSQRWCQQQILFLVFQSNLLILASLSAISVPVLVLITDLSSCDVMPGW